MFYSTGRAKNIPNNIKASPTAVLQTDTAHNWSYQHKPEQRLYTHWPMPTHPYPPPEAPNLQTIPSAKSTLCRVDHNVSQTPHANIRASDDTPYSPLSGRDEPQVYLHSDRIYPYIPWQEDVEKLFKERYGFELTSILIDIFINTENTRYARCCFYSLLSDMAGEAFPVQIQNELSKVSIALSGHYYGEEGFDVHPFYYGDILEHLATMNIPGCDVLRSEAEALRYSVACKLASSAAHISRKDKVLIEASNMRDKDQNITIDVAKAAISMMAVHGVNVISSYYGENLFDENGMREFTSHITNLASIFEGGRYVIDTFLYYPFEELCARCEPEGIVESYIGFQDKLRIGETAGDLMKKKRLLNCKIHKGYLLTPNQNKVYTIVLPDISYVDTELGSYLEKAMENGINVIFDGEERKIENLGFSPKFDLKASCESKELRFGQYDPFVTFMHRAFDSYDLYMLMNTDCVTHSICAEIPSNGEEQFGMVDINTLETRPIAVESVNGFVKISLEIPPLCPAVLWRGIM